MSALRNLDLKTVKKEGRKADGAPKKERGSNVPADLFIEEAVAAERESRSTALKTATATTKWTEAEMDQINKFLKKNRYKKQEYISRAVLYCVAQSIIFDEE